MKSKFRHKVITAALALMMAAAPIGGSVFAAEDFTEAAPEKPAAESYEDNAKIVEYNKKVDNYNKSAKEHNETVDREYEEAVAETNAKNAEIDQHNEAEEERVKTAEESNAKAEQEAAEMNAKIDEENAAEEARVNEHNKSEDEKVKASEEARREAEETNESVKAHNDAVTQYEADKAAYDEAVVRYEKDLAMEQRIKAAGYASVEQYNATIDRYYNEPARKSVEGNANANIVGIRDTYSVTEASEKAGASVSVRIEHIFEGTDVSYSEDFEIDRNDILSIKSIAALGNATEAGYASLYYTTDEAHTMGYWVPYVEFGYNARYVNSTWDCGTAYEVSYKDGKNHANDREEIVALYYYTWVPLKAYKTYNVPVAPTAPENPGERKELVEVPEIYTPNYLKFEKKAHVEAVIETVAAANIIDRIEDPEKGEYVELLSYMALFEEPETVIPAATVADNDEPAGPAAGMASAPEADTETLADREVPMGMNEVTIEDEAAPLADGSAWALLNLIMTIITGIASAILLAGYFGKKEDEDDEENEEAETKRKGLARLASIIPAVSALIIFVITENMSDPMVLTDRWTILMAVILLIQAAVTFIARKTREDRDEEMPEAMNA